MNIRWRSSGNAHDLMATVRVFVTHISIPSWTVGSSISGDVARFKSMQCLNLELKYITRAVVSENVTLLTTIGKLGTLSV